MSTYDWSDITIYPYKHITISLLERWKTKSLKPVLQSVHKRNQDRNLTSKSSVWEHMSSPSKLIAWHLGVTRIWSAMKTHGVSGTDGARRLREPLSNITTGHEPEQNPPKQVLKKQRAARQERSFSTETSFNSTITKWREMCTTRVRSLLSACVSQDNHYSHIMCQWGCQGKACTCNQRTKVRLYYLWNLEGLKPKNTRVRKKRERSVLTLG